MIIEIQLTTSGKQALLTASKRAARFVRAIETGIRRAAHVAAGVVIKESLGGKLLRRRSGALARSVQGRSEGGGLQTVGKVGVQAGPAAKYAAILETGGKITMKGKRLAIPIGAALSPTGRPRYPLGPRSVPDLVLIPRPGRPPILARKIKGGKAIQPLFILKTSVTIPAFGWLSKGMKLARPAVVQTIQADVDKAMEAKG